MLKHRRKVEIVEQIKPIIKKYGLTSFNVFTPRYLEQKNQFNISFSSCKLENMLDYVPLARELKTIKLAAIRITDTSFIDYGNQLEMQSRAKLVEDLSIGEVYHVD